MKPSVSMVTTSDGTYLQVRIRLPDYWTIARKEYAMHRALRGAEREAHEVERSTEENCELAMKHIREKGDSL